MIGYPSYEQIVALHDGLIVSFDGSAAMPCDTMRGMSRRLTSLCQQDILRREQKGSSLI